MVFFGFACEFIALPVDLPPIVVSTSMKYGSDNVGLRAETTFDWRKYFVQNRVGLFVCFIPTRRDLR